MPWCAPEWVHALFCGAQEHSARCEGVQIGQCHCLMTTLARHRDPRLHDTRRYENDPRFKRVRSWSV